MRLQEVIVKQDDTIESLIFEHLNSQSDDLLRLVLNLKQNHNALNSGMILKEGTKLVLPIEIPATAPAILQRKQNLWD